MGLWAGKSIPPMMLHDGLVECVRDPLYEYSTFYTGWYSVWLGYTVLQDCSLSAYPSPSASPQPRLVYFILMVYWEPLDGSSLGLVGVKY